MAGSQGFLLGSMGRFSSLLEVINMSCSQRVRTGCFFACKIVAKVQLICSLLLSLENFLPQYFFFLGRIMMRELPKDKRFTQYQN
jgi:hypothetical protein